MTDVLTAAEAARLAEIASIDEATPADYIVGRGALSGHAFADNRMSMVADLTTGKDIDADTIDEADRLVAGGSR